MTIIILCLGQQETKENIAFVHNIIYRRKNFIQTISLIEWNGDETRQTPLLYVFVDLAVRSVK